MFLPRGEKRLTLFETETKQEKNRRRRRRRSASPRSELSECLTGYHGAVFKRMGAALYSIVSLIKLSRR